MTTVLLEKITKQFGTTTVIKQLDLEIASGEFFTFVGPSGCGKSTLLHMIAGLDQPSSGSILFDGRRMNELSPQQRDVALVFQNYALYPHMTAYENIAFPLKMRKTPERMIDQEVARVAELLGISGQLRRKPKELSGGQRQRVALGRAIVRRPKVFLMDEPLSNLDAKLRIEMRTELARLHRELGITTIYVTHDQSEAMTLSNRVGVLNEGELQQCDTPLTVYRNPANVFVARFIGVPGMNILPARIVGRQPLTVEVLGLRFTPQIQNAPSGDAVLIGIRPADARAVPDNTSSGIPMIVELAEPAGPVTWLTAAGANIRMTAMSRQEENFKRGDACRVAIAADKIFLFDGISGRRL